MSRTAARWIHIAALSLILLGGVCLYRINAAVRPLLILPVCAVIASLLAVAVNPLLYYPQRYLKYSIPVVLLILTPAALSTLPGVVMLSRKSRSPVFACLATAAIVVLLGGRGALLKGSTDRLVERSDVPLFEFLADQPKDILVAGWPRGPIEAVSYATGRRVLLTHETHLVFNEGYTLELRDRMRALVAAYYGAERHDLCGLNAGFGVTHLIVDRKHHGPGNHARYFDSFTPQIQSARNLLERRGLDAVAMEETEAIVFEHDEHFVLDLEALCEPALLPDR